MNEIRIEGHIGFEVLAKDVAASLAAIPEGDEISVVINSPGGDVVEGFAIFDTLRPHSARITTRIVGMAASMASVIALVGKRCVASANSYFIIHNPAAQIFGDHAAMQAASEDLTEMRSKLVGVYVAKTGKSADEIGDAMDVETMLTAKRAMEWGFVDEITGEEKPAAVFDLSRFSAFKAALASTEPNRQNTYTTMKKLFAQLVEARLIASADVSEDVAASQVAAAMTARATVDEDLAAALAKIKELETKLAEMEAAGAKALTESAEAYVAANVASGKIKDDAKVRAKWVAAYVADKEGAVAMIDAIPSRPVGRAPIPVANAQGSAAPSIKCRSTAEAWGTN